MYLAYPLLLSSLSQNFQKEGPGQKSGFGRESNLTPNMLFTYAVKDQTGQQEKTTALSLNHTAWQGKGWEFGDDSSTPSQHSPYPRNGVKPFWPVGKDKVAPLGKLWQHYKMKMFAIYLWLGTAKGFFSSKFYTFFVLLINSRTDMAHFFWGVHIEKK